MDTLSRRGFMSSTAEFSGTLALGAALASTLSASPASAEEKPGKGMKVGMLTAPYGGEPFETAADVAQKAGIACMEVVATPGSKHFDLNGFDAKRADEVKAVLAARNLQISSLSNYSNSIEPGKAEEVLAVAKQLIDAASLLGVDTVCMITGYPENGKSKISTIKEVVPKVFRPIIDYAKGKGVRIALENYFQTCLQGIDTFDCLFETIQDENFGLNYDPSHLFHQQCNHLLPVTRYAKRIFHTHAKDTLVDAEKRAYVGVYGKGWWRYVLPGQGNINWGEYISHLRENGYLGVMSIEHEDETFTKEDGFIHAARYLNQFC